MNIVIFGASGGVGRCLVEQALAQDHHVTAAVRHPATVHITHERLRVLSCDSSTQLRLIKHLQGKTGCSAH